MRFRRQIKESFTKVSNAVLNDKDLSWKAKGIYAYLVSKPEEWIYYWEEVVQHSTDGERSFRSGLKELLDAGYVARVRIRNDKGFFDWETHIYDEKHAPNPLVDDARVDDARVENVPPNKIESSKTLSSKTEKIEREIYLDFVKLSLEDYEKLVSQMGHGVVEALIERLNDYIGGMGKDPYASHFHVIRSWKRKDDKEAAQAKGNRSYQPKSPHKPKIPVVTSSDASASRLSDEELQAARTMAQKLDTRFNKPKGADDGGESEIRH